MAKDKDMEYTDTPTAMNSKDNGEMMKNLQDNTSFTMTGCLMAGSKRTK